MTIHVPVLLAEVLELLDPQAGDVVIDATFGAGGHSRAIAERIAPTARSSRSTVIRSRRSVRGLRGRGRVRHAVRHAADFAGGLQQLEERNSGGRRRAVRPRLSSPQIDDTDRGFSYSRDAPLDMRMDPEQTIDAVSIVAKWSRRDLTPARSSSSARSATRGSSPRRIERARATAPITTTGELDEGDRRRGAGAPALSGGTPPRGAGFPGAAHRRQRRARTRSTTRCLWRWGGCCALAADGRDQLPLARGTGASSSSWHRSPRTASARPSCRSAAAAESPRLRS